MAWCMDFVPAFKFPPKLESNQGSDRPWGEGGYKPTWSGCCNPHSKQSTPCTHFSRSSVTAVDGRSAGHGPAHHPDISSQPWRAQHPEASARGAQRRRAPLTGQGTRQDAGEGDALLRKRAVVVTGASTGIGLAAAALLLQRGFRVFGSVRRPADAERLQAQLGPGFTPLLFDVTDEAAVRAAAQQARLP